MNTARVAIRQWLALVALENAPLGTLTISEARAALRVRSPGDYGAGVLEGLLSAGLAVHACPSLDHRTTPECQVRIADPGREARMTRRAIRLASQLARR